MDMAGTSRARDPVEAHGAAMDKDKNRVRCKYCGKEVHGFNRLKHHLGGVGTDVVACVHVPEDVKNLLRDTLLGKRKERFFKEVGSLHHPELPLRRHLSSSGEDRGSQPNQAATMASQAPELVASGPSVSGTSNGNIDVPLPADVVTMEEGVDVPMREEVKNASHLAAAKCVGKFFNEAGIDPSAIELPSFRQMINAAIECGSGFNIPNHSEVRGWILEDNWEEVHARVEEVKRSWGQTGCSILLDVWTDKRGMTLIGFLADCPKGTIFLRSVDATGAIHDVSALVLLISKVIEEVGVSNVVQVIGHDTSSHMKAAGKKVMEKYKTLYLTVCADHCINLILERIETFDHVRKVLDEAKTITRFIYSHASSLQLLKKHIVGELVISSTLKSVVPFLTLENMVSKKESLTGMITSRAWTRSTWSSKAKGKMVYDLVKNPSFWAAAVDVVKITSPLIGVLHQINGGCAAPMGFLYDKMDTAKEEIKKNLGGGRSTYLPYWTIIDGIWNDCLHSPLHSAGYFVNPTFFNSKDFFVDDEVKIGMSDCILRMVGDRRRQEKIALQLQTLMEDYEGFAEEIADNQVSKVAPAMWWSLYGGSTPELQKLAIKILSQTCSTSARYNLRKESSEQLHGKTRNCIEQQQFSDREFVCNNLRLCQSESNRDLMNSLTSKDLSLMDDWLMEK